MQNDLIWGGGLFVAVVVTAALVNRFNPGHRSRVRRTVILFIVYGVALALKLALAAAGLDLWAGRFGVAAEMLAAFTVVNIAATVLISIALPATGAALPMIATDLLVGFGYVVATLGVLSTHGLNPTGALASAAVVSAVLAISLQSTLGNILGGVALQLDGSVHEGDWVQLENGKQGRVRAIRWRHTVVETRDWSTIIVPNAQLLANNITILGKRDGRAVPQRMWVWFNVDFRFPHEGDRRGHVRAVRVADRGRRPRSAAELRLHGFHEGAARELRDLRCALLADRSRARRRDELARPRPRVHCASPSRYPPRRSRADRVGAARGRASRGEQDQAAHHGAGRSPPPAPALPLAHGRGAETLAEGMSHVIYTAGRRSRGRARSPTGCTS